MYLLLTLIISGLKQPGNNIDVFLEPLMEDKKVLWKDGVKMMDAYVKKEFTQNPLSLSPSSITLAFLHSRDRSKVSLLCGLH